MSEYITNESDLAIAHVDLGHLMRRKVQEAVCTILDEELAAALECARYERVEDRKGYRNGCETRRITTESGPMDIAVPRGRLFQEDGSTTEFRSQLLPRYARRTRRVDEAILGTYLAGANTRRIKKALAPLFGKANLSKSAISRVVQRLGELFDAWDQRDLSDEYYAILFLDAVHLKVRLARRVVSAPVLVVLGVCPTGERRVVALRLAVSESGRCWCDLVADLERRGLQAPLLVVSDGHRGLKKATELWPEAQVQRCTFHKLQNLLDHCPKHAHTELRRDYHAIIHAEDGKSARQKYQSFEEKWQKICPAVMRSISEANTELLTFYEFPPELWRGIRTTNSLECLNREFRRRTKTQASFSTEKAAVTLLYGLLAFSQIRLRRVDGYRTIPMMLVNLQQKAA